MTYTLLDLLRLEHIVLGVAAQDAEEIIRSLSDLLAATGFVQESFAEDVWEREQTYPTGLPTEPIAVAIPHADPDHVNQSAVCLGVLTKTVEFSQMGTDGSVVVDARIVFLLAIKEVEKQVVLIQQLMELIQNPDLLRNITASQSPEEILELITDSMGAN